MFPAGPTIRSGLSHCRNRLARSSQRSDVCHDPDTLSDTVVVSVRRSATCSHGGTEFDGVRHHCPLSHRAERPSLMKVLATARLACRAPFARTDSLEPVALTAWLCSRWAHRLLAHIIMRLCTIHTLSGSSAIAGRRPSAWLPEHSPVTEGYPHQQGLLGKSKQEVLACAGPPLQERVEGPLTTLRYYKEAPLLEESMVGSKGSRPTVHHGCWASVVLQDQRVNHVRYRFVPSSVDASNDCEAIFADCPQ